MKNELTKYKLRLLFTDRINVSTESDKHGEVSRHTENLPVEVSVEAEHVEIVNGKAIFMNGESVVTVLPLDSFLWAPLGQTPPNVRMKPFEIKNRERLHPHDFSFHAVLNFTNSMDRIMDSFDTDTNKRTLQYKRDNIKIFKPSTLS